MKKLLIMVMTTLSLLMLNACVPDISGDTIYSTDSSVTDNSITYGEGTVLDCTESNCTVAVDQTEGNVGDAVVGDYDADYAQTECTAAGFFYCEIDSVCTDTPAATGTCDS